MADDLVRLHVETTCNTSDKELIANVRANARHAALVPHPVNDRTLYICGSGPSLTDTLHGIPPNADVMALNGAYRVLLDSGRVPEYFCMLDAREVNRNFLESWDVRTKAILASQVHPHCVAVIEAFGSPILMYHLNTPTTKQASPGQKIYIGGGTVGLTSIAVAGVMGYRHIVLLGFDSSYANGAGHARPQPQNAADKTLDVWVEDRKYLTTPAMAQQAMDFFQWNDGLQAAFPGLALDIIGDGLFYDYVVTNNGKTATRESEAAKYATMYKEGDYGMPAHRLAGIRDILADRPGTALLDVGTGRGETLLVARECGYTIARGTETVPALLNDNVTYGLLPDLEVLDDAYDTVTCFEVIEHLLPGDVIPALLKLERIARKRVIVSLATASDMRSGIELHPSWKPEVVWDALVAALWGDKVRKIGNLSSVGLSPVYEYVK